MILSVASRWIPLEWINKERSNYIYKAFIWPLSYKLYYSLYPLVFMPKTLNSGLLVNLVALELMPLRILSYSSYCYWDFFSFFYISSILGLFFAFILCISTFVPLYFMLTFVISIISWYYTIFSNYDLILLQEIIGNDLCHKIEDIRGRFGWLNDLWVHYHIYNFTGRSFYISYRLLLSLSYRTLPIDIGILSPDWFSRSTRTFYSGWSTP